MHYADLGSPPQCVGFVESFQEDPHAAGYGIQHASNGWDLNASTHMGRAIILFDGVLREDYEMQGGPRCPFPQLRYSRRVHVCICVFARACAASGTTYARRARPCPRAGAGSHMFSPAQQLPVSGGW